MSKLKLLDLYCKAGGTSMGYFRAGFDVIGVDHEPQPKYPFEFIQADAIEYLCEHWDQYDLISASPPCQRYSTITKTGGRDLDEYPELIEITRTVLKFTGKPYIIENVPRAPLRDPVTLCGTMFGLMVVRHRKFETWPIQVEPPCECNHWTNVVKHGRPPKRGQEFHGVTGHFSDVEYAREAMDINWMSQKELAQAIPPAYTHWVGRKFIQDYFKVR